MSDESFEDICIVCDEPASGMRCPQHRIVYSYASNFTKQTDATLDEVDD